MQGKSIPIEVPIIVNLAGGKGGVGTSTITANIAYALGEAGSGFGTIGVIDLAYGANSTLSKLLGVPPLGTNGFWNYITARYYPYQDSSPNITPQLTQQIALITSGTIEAHRIDWALSYVLSRMSNDPDQVGWALYNDIAELIVNKLLIHKPSLVIIDVPSAIFKPLAWAVLMMSRIVNVVVKAGSTHQDEAMEVLGLVSAVINQRAQLGLAQPDVFLIVNQAFPGDNTANELKARGVPMRGTSVLPYSPAVHYITDYMKDLAVKYEVPQDKFFRQWRDTILAIARNEYEVARSARQGRGFFRLKS
ncbi:hypothetical protein [Vulcanisaeta souniana]|uniref:CobQ/CobB/MinD/ParA nucleotide binding domain-containing protein n=1 Tax=Vulcanisaeta souniana JCM 11219 TaxID=1293586 RepID=A0A830EIF6_9CREN|nr:hypothetical protein [Vulcanisaeta souniana]BDR92220.1 hypothetical protein Vsou_13130 [Vulcanisaeta souniana JCM 11219]GGI85987.1 hypothetical protein GCM10007112_23700 [Vulcanisaeta souniana JCM 11219]